MKRVLGIFCSLALLSGCASFKVAPMRLCDPEQVWEAKAIRFNPDIVSKTGVLSAVVFRVPESWIKDEQSGIVSHGSTGLLTVNRDAWRAFVFLSDDGTRIETSALRGPENNLVVLLPGVSSERAVSASVFVVSGLGTFVLDSEEHEYGGKESFDSCLFLEEQRGKYGQGVSLQNIANLSPSTEKGMRFLGALYAKFSEKKIFDGKVFLVASVPNIERATSGVLSPDDYFFSNLDLLVTPGMGVVSAMYAVGSTAYGITTAKPEGPYREAKSEQKTSDFMVTTPELSGRIGNK